MSATLVASMAISDKPSFINMLQFFSERNYDSLTKTFNGESVIAAKIVNWAEKANDPLIVL